MVAGFVAGLRLPNVVVEIVFAPSLNNYFGHVGTRCQFPGNFDARVDFSLMDWPAANGMVVALQAFFEPNNYGWAGTFSAELTRGREQYGGLISGGNGASTPLDDSSGTFRLGRRNGVITTYFLPNGQWIRLGSDVSRSPVVITVGAYSATSLRARNDQNRC